MIYDCVVIGGGVVGLSAAYQLAKKDKNVVLIEQFPLPHNRGSSHGASRILRKSYSDSLYANMTIEALDCWKQLELETDTQLFRETGLMVFEGSPYKEYEECLRSVKKCNGRSVEYTRDEIRKKYPDVISLPSDYKMYIELDAGTLRADKALRCLQEQIKKFGGQIFDEEKVESIIPGQIVTVTTNKGVYTTKSVVITPGAWIPQLLNPLGLKPPVNVERVTVCYWKEKRHGSTQSMPAFIDLEFDIYGLPSSEYEGLMKICLHGGVSCSPDTRDDHAAASTKRDIDILCKYVREHFPGICDKPSIVETCMYTITPDSGFILDTLPYHHNIAYGCGFSGHGFKMAPVTGRILGEMATGERVSYNISSLRLTRFPGTTISANL